MAVSPVSALAATRQPMGGPVAPSQAVIANLNRTAARIVYRAKQGTLQPRHVSACTGTLRMFFDAHPGVIETVQAQVDAGYLNTLPAPETFKSQLAAVVPGTVNTDYNPLEQGLAHANNKTPVSLLVHNMLDDLEANWQGPVGGVPVSAPWLPTPYWRLQRTGVIAGQICWPAAYGALVGLLALCLSGPAAIAFGILAFVYGFEAVFTC